MRIFLSALSAALILAGAAAAEAKLMNKTITYDHDGVVMEGYLAWDDAAKDPRPGILIVHQWMGLTDYEKMRADMLAELGYVAFAADIYGKGVRPKTVEEAQKESAGYYQNVDLYRARVSAGLDVLREQPLVDEGRIAAIGYCFGGSGVLELARSGADIGGVVSFHGLLSTAKPAEEGVIRAKVLVCHGAVDPYVKPEAVRAFLDEMEDAGADYRLIMYGHAVHSFTHKEAGDDPSAGAAYNEKADRRSWRAMRDFFDEIFK